MAFIFTGKEKRYFYSSLSLFLQGSDAPTRSNLRTWLKEHPTFEVVGTNNLGALQIGKTITTIQTQVPGKTVSIEIFF